MFVPYSGAIHCPANGSLGDVASFLPFMSYANFFFFFLRVMLEMPKVYGSVSEAGHWVVLGSGWGTVISQGKNTGEVQPVGYTVHFSHVNVFPCTACSDCSLVTF